MASNLSEGAVEAIMNNRQTDPVAQNPVLQVVSSMKPIQARNPGNPTRYRCAISDGAYTITAIFATQLNGLIEGGQLTKHSIIRVTNYQANQLSANNKIMVVLGVEHLGNVEGRIGNPQAYTDGGSSSSAGQQQQPQPQQQQQQQAPAPAI
ncbi:Replication factor A protein 1, partial [Spiromyces aspiralis]